MRTLSEAGICWLLFVAFVSSGLEAAAEQLTAQEKMEFIKSSTTTCIAKNNASRTLTQSEKDGVRNYCGCHAGVMASLATREEMKATIQGKVPQSFQAKVVEARKQCIESLLQYSAKH